MTAIMHGELPSKPSALKMHAVENIEVFNSLWEICLRCWSTIPSERPSASRCMEDLGDIEIRTWRGAVKIWLRLFDSASEEITEDMYKDLLGFAAYVLVLMHHMFANLGLTGMTIPKYSH